MVDLRDRLALAALRQQPSGQPPFAEIERRAKQRRRNKTGVVGFVAALTAGAAAVALGGFDHVERSQHVSTPPTPLRDTSVSDCRGPVRQQAQDVATRIDAVTSYSTTAGEVAAWHEARYTGNASGRRDEVMRRYDADTLVSLCVFDGRFTFPGGPAGSAGDQPSRAVLLDVDGQVIWDIHGEPASRRDWVPPSATRTS
jgi:hypothetical protein